MLTYKLPSETFFSEFFVLCVENLFLLLLFFLQFLKTFIEHISIYNCRSLELSWYENGAGSSFFNLSCLPAFLNTSCLHRLLCLSDLSIHTRGAQVCSLRSHFTIINFLANLFKLLAYFNFLFYAPPFFFVFHGGRMEEVKFSLLCSV